MEHLIDIASATDNEAKYSLLVGCTIDDLTEEELRIMYRQKMKNEEREKVKFDKIFQEKTILKKENEELKDRIKMIESNTTTINQLNVTIDTLLDKLEKSRKRCDLFMDGHEMVGKFGTPSMSDNKPILLSIKGTLEEMKPTNVGTKKEMLYVDDLIEGIEEMLMKKLEQEITSNAEKIAKVLARGNNVEIKRDSGDRIKVYKVERKTVG